MIYENGHIELELRETDDGIVFTIRFNELDNSIVIDDIIVLEAISDSIKRSINRKKAENKRKQYKVTDITTY